MKKLFLTLAAVLACLLGLTMVVLADTVHNETTVDYNETVILDSGDECQLFDSEGNALIWYLDNNGLLCSIRADDTEDGADGKRVVYVRGTRDNVLVNINIYSGDTVVGRVNNILVFNIMDDDINCDANINEDGVQPFTVFMETFNAQDKNRAGGMKLEYAYLRLDTTSIGGKAFACCYNLKYINLEKMTELELIGAVDGYNHGGTFFKCTSLFANKVLDLSKTKLAGITQGGMTNDGNFEQVPFTSVIFPETLSVIERWTLDSCPNLVSVTFGSEVKIDANTFLNATAIEKIFFVGTLDSLKTVISNAHSSGNDIFWNIVGSKDKGAISSGRETGNLISYADYLSLNDKSGNYIVYNYSRCEVYNNNLHGELTLVNSCVGTCNLCGATVVSHAKDAELTVNIEYLDYAAKGTRMACCTNDGCAYNVTEEVPALFVCLGYSAPENGTGGIAIGFTVNNEAIKAYEEVTGKTLKYGVFAVLQSRLGDNDVFAEDGTVAEGAINADITSYEFALFELKIVGFTDEYKDIKLAMGAYVAVTDGETTEYSYMQGGEPNENEKYCFVSYNDIVGAPSNDEEVTQ